MAEKLTKAMRGRAITCARCRGHGVVESWPNIPDECPDCGGSGQNWQYPNGAIAQYYTGPFIGRRAALEEASHAE